MEEDATAIVPISHLQEQDNLEHGGSCIVTWSNKKAYKAMLICSGLHTLFVVDTHQSHHMRLLNLLLHKIKFPILIIMLVLRNDDLLQ